MSAAWILLPNVFWGYFTSKLVFRAFGILELETNTIHSPLKAHILSSIRVTANVAFWKRRANGGLQLCPGNKCY